MTSRYLDSRNTGNMLKFSFFPVNASNGWLHLESSGELSRGGAGKGGSICLSVFGKQTKIHIFFYSLNVIKLYGMIVFNWVNNKIWKKIWKKSEILAIKQTQIKTFVQELIECVWLLYTVEPNWTSLDIIGHHSVKTQVLKNFT